MIVFLPQILLLFLFIGILEDSGYLARAALIADRTMARIRPAGQDLHPAAFGLRLRGARHHGHAHHRKQARPHRHHPDRAVHDLLGAAAGLHADDRGVHPRTPAARAVSSARRPAALLGLYVLGFLAAIAHRAAAEIVRPEERARRRSCWRCRPTAGPLCVARRCGWWTARRVFLRRAGTVILAGDRRALGAGASALHNGQPPAIGDSIAGMIGHAVEPVDQAAGLQLEDRHRPDHVAGGARSDRRNARDHLRHGRHVAESVGLQQALRSDLTPGGAVALLVFFAFAMQCMSTMAVVRRETGGWKWPAIQFAYMTFLAYVCALITNEVVRSGII